LNEVPGSRKCAADREEKVAIPQRKRPTIQRRRREPDLEQAECTGSSQAERRTGEVRWREREANVWREKFH